jgi:acyl carrier protein
VAQAIRRRVTARLGITPEFVVPIPKSRFPKTTSGKIQRMQLKRALEAGAYRETIASLFAEDGAEGSRSPANEVEAQVFGIWREVLGDAGVRLNAHLFELGGDSLKATQIASRIRERWRVEFPMHLLFSGAGTIEGMAEWIAENLNRGERDAAPAIQPVPRQATLPLSYSQLRLWLAEQIDPGTSLYNIGRAYRLKGMLDFPTLERTLQRIVERHEILRTTYRLEDMPVQEIQPELQIPIPRHDLAHLPASERDRVVGNLLTLEISRPFDLAVGPLLRGKLIRVGAEEHLLVLTCHQIVTDGWSLGLIARELAEIYTCFAGGQAAPLPALRVQYADYAVWQQRWFADAALEKQLSFWKHRLSERIAPLQFPAPGATSSPSNASGTRQLVLTQGALEKLRAFNAAENVTSYMTLLAVYKLLLSHWAGTAQVVVGSPESGRRRLETENLLGCFVNLLPLATRISPGDTFRTVLSHVRETAIEAFAHADVPFEKIQALVQPSNDGMRSRLFRVWFGPIDSLQPFAMGGLQVEPQAVFPPEAQFDLSCFLAEHAGSITCHFEYKRDLFTVARVEEMLEQFRSVLANSLEHPDTSVSEILAKVTVSTKNE